MATRTVIPFGPQHPVLPEPLHLDLLVEDETVVEAVPSIGFIHRGLEKLVEKIEFTEFTHIAERICGICSFIHGLTYCQGIERLMQVEVPPRALYLRTFWSELSRVHSHLLWLGLMADAMGFESLFMHLWRLRERILDINGYQVITAGSGEEALEVVEDVVEDDVEKPMKKRTLKKKAAEKKATTSKKPKAKKKTS